MPNRVMHAKTAIIDESFATIGSYNLDERSWRKNMEVNLAVEDDAFARHMRASFDEDCEDARRIDLDEWRDRARRFGAGSSGSRTVFGGSGDDRRKRATRSCASPVSSR